MCDWIVFECVIFVSVCYMVMVIVVSCVVFVYVLWDDLNDDELVLCVDVGV